MYSINECAKMVEEQGQNVLACAKELVQIARKTGKERTDLFERYCANQHSFNVYTYINASIENLEEVQLFQRKIVLVGSAFVETRTDYEAEVDVQQAEITYEVLITAFHEMTNALEVIEKTEIEK